MAASNDGVDAATGEFVVLVDHDDLLTPDALETVAEAIERRADADYLYSDEDKIDADGDALRRFRKPDWSPERLRGQMYTGHLSVMRAALVRGVGGFRPGFDGSQDHDLALRVTEQARASSTCRRSSTTGGSCPGRPRATQRQALRMGSGPQSGPGTPRPQRHRRPGGFRAASPATTG